MIHKTKKDLSSVEKKIDSSIRSDGAEVYVQGKIMLELGFPTALASRNMPGYDVIAHNLETDKSCKIQVKYRSAVNNDGFHFKNYRFHIGVLVIGNLGKIGSNDLTKHGKTEFYIVPEKTIKSRRVVKQNEDVFPNPNQKKHKDLKKFQDRWDLIVKHLS